MSDKRPARGTPRRTTVPIVEPDASPAGGRGVSGVVRAAPGASAPRTSVRVPLDAAAVLGALPVPTVVVDREGRFLFANAAAEQFFQISASNLAASRLSDLLPPDSPLFVLIDQARERGAPIVEHDVTLESPRVARAGVSVRAAPLGETRGLDDEPVVVALQDATTAQKLDRQLAFRSAARSVTGMAAVLAHEVKNPLSGIRGAAQLLEASVSEADRELTQLIQDEALRIRDLVDRMETFGERPLTRASLNIHEVLDHVKRVSRAGFARQVRFLETYDPSLPMVWGNRDQLVQVFLNLVKNAVEAAPRDQGEIELRTAYQHGVRLAVPGSDSRVHLPLVVAVRDNGEGIPDSLRAHLFDPFVSTKASGQGLGLALVAKIIGDHGGLIEFDSRPGRTEFRLFLPMPPEPEVAPAPARAQRVTA